MSIGYSVLSITVKLEAICFFLGSYLSAITKGLLPDSFYMSLSVLLVLAKSFCLKYLLK